MDNRTVVRRSNRKKTATERWLPASFTPNVKRSEHISHAVTKVKQEGAEPKTIDSSTPGDSSSWSGNPIKRAQRKKKENGKDTFLPPAKRAKKNKLSDDCVSKFEEKVSTTVKVEHNATRPTPEECRWVTSALATLHPHVIQRNDERRRQTLLESCGMRSAITDAVISTILSQNTTDANSRAAYASLQRTFPKGWDDVARCADTKKIENAIRMAGLAKTRAKRIQDFLRTLQEERGTTSLEYLRHLSNEEIKTKLNRFAGLGPKTISCVLLFGLGRTDEFPVDTHVLRITTKLGWVPSGTSRENAYNYLNEVVPNDCKLDLHCLLVTHGKHCHRCAAKGRPQFPPLDGTKLRCPLVNIPSFVGTVTNEEGRANGTNIEPATRVGVKEEDGPSRCIQSNLTETSVKREDIAVKSEDD